MKQRFSKYKAEWSNEREQEYHKKCETILFQIKHELFFDGDEVYLKSERQTILLLKSDKPKSKWYEIWLNLKNKEDQGNQ